MELTEIKSELDRLYHEYKTKSKNFNGNKKQSVVELIISIMSLKDADYHDVAVELKRFSADVTKLFFENITKSEIIPFEVVNNILKELSATYKDVKSSQYYVSKYVWAITSIMENYKENALKSALLPQLVVFIACSALRNNKNRNKFRTLIINTSGGIFALDYSDVKTESLVSILEATKNVFPDKSEYEELITEWSNKYIFNNEKFSDVSVNKEIPVENPVTENTITENFCDTVMKNMSENKKDIINAVTELISPISSTINSIQKDINKIREIENITLRSEVDALERKLSKQKDKLRKMEFYAKSAEAENDTLRQQITVLESQNAELDRKLDDAYSIHNRNSLLAVEKVRSELRKAFKYLYEDWLEYESSDVNEENYQSLQAIIKKTFRSLERNGIKFKEE